MMPLAMAYIPAGKPSGNPPKRGWLHLATIDITPLAVTEISGSCSLGGSSRSSAA